MMMAMMMKMAMRRKEMVLWRASGLSVGRKAYAQRAAARHFSNSAPRAVAPTAIRSRAALTSFKDSFQRAEGGRGGGGAGSHGAPLLLTSLVAMTGTAHACCDWEGGQDGQGDGKTSIETEMKTVDTEKGSTRHVNFSVSKEDEVGGVKRVAKEVVPDWESIVNDDELGVEQIQGGITNRLYRVHRGNVSVLVRIYGDNTEVLINRKVDENTFAELTTLGFGVQLLATFDNGRVEQFYVGARTLEPEDMAIPHISQKIAATLCRMHLLQPESSPGSKEKPILFDKLREWLKISLQVSFPADEEKQRKLVALNLGDLAVEIENLAMILEEIDSPVVFCHNDLLSGNILYRERNGEMVFVDMEYGGYNYRGFDIGNHFNEFAGFDYSKIWDMYPNKAEQYNFLHEYLLQLKGAAYHVSDKELDDFYEEANKFALASHLFWGLWAVVQAKHSPIDFDYLKYAHERLEAYFAFKQKLESAEHQRHA